MRNLGLAALLAASAGMATAQPLFELVGKVRERARALESSSGMRLGFRTLAAAHGIPPERFPDYAVARLLFEATRDAGFWSLHWKITNREPNSDNIWRQWQSSGLPALVTPTASAECDELSALYAFLAGRAGVRSVGLFWPTWNHTVAVWVVTRGAGPPVRVVVPTTQIFLNETDLFGTKRFDPWRQKSISEYRRRDVPDSFVLPRPLFEFFLMQAEKYGGATDATLQRLRYLREGVFLRSWTPEMAAREALRRRDELKNGPAEDVAAFQHFAQDMRAGQLR